MRGEGGGTCEVKGACVVKGGHAWQSGACVAKGGVHGGRGGGCVAGETATAADGRHPTGMHSCFDSKTVVDKCAFSVCRAGSLTIFQKTKESE